jgi:hypothetical protein
MRKLISLAAVSAILLFSPAAAETIDCPSSTLERTVRPSPPSGWYTTPVRSRLTETRITTIGGQLTMMCIYGEAGSVQREVASGQTCTARSGGFECSSGGAPALAPASEVHSEGAFSVRGTYEFDLDAGAESARSAAEFWYEIVRDGDTYFTPRGGARLAAMGASAPSYGDCTSATYSSARTRVETLRGPWLCVRTNEGRISRFRIDGVDRLSRPQRMTITYTTWR